MLDWRLVVRHPRHLEKASEPEIDRLKRALLNDGGGVIVHFATMGPVIVRCERLSLEG